MRLREEYRETTIINKSRFIACVMPCETEEQARLYIEMVRSDFPDASHVCTAYMVGENNTIQRSSDNKEPSGTAGVPMLESIRKSGLSGVCACVVRYFGGIKLGAGGLIRAYSGAVADALAHAPKTEEVPVNIWKVTYPYDMCGTLENWLRRNTDITDLAYGEQVTCTFEAPAGQDIPAGIRDLTRGVIEPVSAGTAVRERSID